MRYDIQTLKAFVAIAEEGTIAGAAAREHTVPSGISKRISEMEALCGTVLLNRHRRGVSLTPAGVELLAHAKRILDDLARLDTVLGDYASGVRGQVRILANTSAIVQFLPRDFASFIEKNPTVKLDLEERTSEETQKTLLAGLADIGIMVAFRPLEGLHFEPYREDRLVAIMPKAHPLALKKEVRFVDMLTYDQVGLPRGTSLCDMLTEQAKDSGIPLKLRIQATSFEGLVLMVSVGIGVAVLPEGSVIPLMKSLNVTARPLADKWARRQLVLVQRKDQELSGVARLLWEHLRGSE
jgi:DNA-binding transcriptional LysR family regulator